MEQGIVLSEYYKKRSRVGAAFKKYGTAGLFLAPFIIANIVFFLVPLFYGIYISLTNYSYGFPGQETFNNFSWYRIIFDKSYGSYITEAFWRSFFHTIVFGVIMVPVSIIFPLFLAILINAKPPAYKLFRALVYLPSIVPLTATASIFVILFNPAQSNGILATFFPNFGPKEWWLDTWFTFKIGSLDFDVKYAWIPIWLMCFWGGWGGNFIILSAGLQNVPKSLYEASSVDGCNKWKQILHVTLPGIKPQIVLCLFTTIIGYMGLYGQNYVLTSGGPNVGVLGVLPGGGKTSTIMYFIQDIVANNTNFRAKWYGLGAAASIVYAIFVGIISGLQMFITRDKKTGFKISRSYEQWNKIRSLQ